MILVLQSSIWVSLNMAHPDSHGWGLVYPFGLVYDSLVKCPQLWVNPPFWQINIPRFSWQDLLCLFKFSINLWGWSLWIKHPILLGLKIIIFRSPTFHKSIRRNLHPAGRVLPAPWALLHRNATADLEVTNVQRTDLDDPERVEVSPKMLGLAPVDGSSDAGGSV